MPCGFQRAPVALSQEPVVSGVAAPETGPDGSHPEFPDCAAQGQTGGPGGWDRLAGVGGHGELAGRRVPIVLAGCCQHKSCSGALLSTGP
jgi:hypothetical protein